MGNIFSGLESLGFKDVEKVDVFQENEKGKGAAASQQEKKPETTEEDLLFDKSYTTFAIPPTILGGYSHVSISIFINNLH